MSSGCCGSCSSGGRASARAPLPLPRLSARGARAGGKTRVQFMRRPLGSNVFSSSMVGAPSFLGGHSSHSSCSMMYELTRLSGPANPFAEKANVQSFAAMKFPACVAITRHHSSTETMPPGLLLRSSQYFFLKDTLYWWNTCVSQGCSNQVNLAAMKMSWTAHARAVRRTGSCRCAGQQSSKSTGFKSGKSRTTRAMARMMACINGASIQRDGSLSKLTFSGSSSTSSRCTRAGRRCRSPTTTCGKSFWISAWSQINAACVACPRSW